MNKEEILLSGAAKVPAHFTASAKAAPGAMPRFASLRAAAQKWNKLALVNVLLLTLVAAMTGVMIWGLTTSSSTRRPGQPESRIEASARTAPSSNVRIVSGPLPVMRPTVIVSRGDAAVQAVKAAETAAAAIAADAETKAALTVEEAIYLPLRRVPEPKQRVVAATHTRTAAPMPLKSKATALTAPRNASRAKSIVIDGSKTGNPRLSARTATAGDLYLWNMKRFTLPCGLRVDGDLYLKNVGLLKFCGSFDIRGNIYVSNSSSFGPLPKTARLGGQVVF